MEHWRPARLFAHETIIVIGERTALTDEQLAALRGRRAIAVNTACHRAMWPAVLLFAPSGGFRAVAAIAERDPTIRATHLFQARETLAGFPDAAVRYGPTAQHLAAGLAIALGARRVVLTGARFSQAFRAWHAEAAAIGVELLEAEPESEAEDLPHISLAELIAERVAA